MIKKIIYKKVIKKDLNMILKKKRIKKVYIKYKLNIVFYKNVPLY